MPLTTARRVPVATYRLQLRKEFPFAAAEAMLAHAQALGISDLYCSPILLSTPGSSHGYDVNDYRRIDPELGGRGALERLHGALMERGMGLLLDFVPNHMGINGPGLLNAWWRDVLENGEHSPHARFFDIDWNAGGGGAGQSRVLVPVLGDHYGRVLERGELSLVQDGGTLSLAYGEMRLPVEPQTYRLVLEAIAPGAGPGLAALAKAFGELGRLERGDEAEARGRRGAQFGELKQALGEALARAPKTRPALEARLRAINGEKGSPRSFDELDRLIERQHYRLAYWRAGVHETNYRRFFAIDTLIGLRVEIPEVFCECHALLARLLQEGVVTGLRIDHIDGLRDPWQYLERLQELVRTDEVGGRTAPLYVAVEKITAAGEPLPASWATQGTTGYEFIAQLAGLFVDARTEAAFTRTYAELAGKARSFEDVVAEKKRLVLDELFANAVTQFAHQLAEWLRMDRRWRDVTRHELTVAVREIMAAHGVYRTYRREREPMDERDRRVVEQACAIAIARNRRMPAEPFEVVREVLTGDFPDADAPEGLHEGLAEWVLSFQQYTGAVMAKAVEDTAFFTYSRFVALNEVGGEPGRFGGTVAAFHAANAARAKEAPQAMLTTATHDTKLGEDVRARLYALSELPQAWREWVMEWAELNRGYKTAVNGRPAPDADEEYRLYQLLLGVWPADDAEPDDVLRARMREHLRKAVNEAKRNTSWTQPNEAWLEAGDKFVNAILSPETAREFLANLRERAQWLARLGMVNSLAQVVLKVTSPGVPDFYQGSELWDLSLVDPDNRRAVDFAARGALTATEGPPRWQEWLRDWRTGEIKLRVTQALLRFRGAHAELFREGDYRPLEVSGRFANHAVAFARTLGAERVVVIVPRLTSRLGCPPLGLVWDDTAVRVEEAGAGGAGWRDVLTGRTFSGQAEGTLALYEVFAELPVAVLRNGG